MKPTLLSFYMHETGDDARVTLREETLGLAPSTISLPLPASIHAPLRRLLANALVEMGLNLAEAMLPPGETRDYYTYYADDDDPAETASSPIRAATDLGGPFNPNKRTAE